MTPSPEFIKKTILTERPRGSGNPRQSNSKGGTLSFGRGEFYSASVASYDFFHNEQTESKSIVGGRRLRRVCMDKWVEYRILQIGWNRRAFIGYSDTTSGPCASMVIRTCLAEA
jgi:hypothetical protein